MMAPTSAGALLVTAIALMSAAALQLSAAAPAAPPAPIGLPGCDTTCGGVSVPYPFGFQPRCYRRGFNLTCDRSHDPPRLLLGDGTFRVVDIFLHNSTLRVHRYGPMLYHAHNITSDGLNVMFARSFAGGAYKLTFGNELVLSGCNVLATLVADKAQRRADDDGGDPYVFCGCASVCESGYSGSGYAEGSTISFGTNQSYCSGHGCCHVSIASLHVDYNPTEVHLMPLDSLKHWDDNSNVSMLLAEEGWLNGTNSQEVAYNEEIPLLLKWDNAHGLVLSVSGKESSEECPRNIARLCKSNHSKCVPSGNGDFLCECKPGYDGNPYVAGGCQDVDECMHPQDTCFGDCTNTDGWFECRCPSGTFGDPTVRDGCFKANSSATGSLHQLGMVAPQIGLPGCDTTCGNVDVPYPFGFGPSSCYLQGFGLTCDKSHNPPRLLLGGNSTLQVVEISLNDYTVRVIHTNTFDVTISADREVFGSRGFRFQDDDKQIGVHFPDIGEPYMLSATNEFIVTGCNVEAKLIGEYRNTTDSIISSCVSKCSSGVIGDPTHKGNEYCSGRDGCCHARIPPGSRPKNVTFKRLPDQDLTQESILPPVAFVAEEGQIHQWYLIFNRSTAYSDIRSESWARDAMVVRPYMASQVPLVLRWVVNKQQVRTGVQSDCRQENGSYTCQCEKGFHGNPYIIDGCQDIDECMIPEIRNACFGYCYNFPGSHECRCPRGTRGDPYQPDGCVETISGLKIGLLVSIGPALLLLVLGATLGLRKVKQRRIKLLKQKHFKQNRGQLLQQLVSQRADIAERMIIPVDELAKATNNFDKARELGGGGHGTVYKGILSDLHVVAIKKSKITVQKEIDEFINEVAILSQINHRNVVKLFGCCLETEVPLLVYEFISNGTLYHHLHVDEPKSLPWETRLRIAIETASALSYLHSSVSIPIIHRDIKSSNILLDDAFTSKVSDFGASRYIPVDKTGLTTRVQGTKGYLDPMYFYTGRLTEKSDVYSFGVILVELLTRKKPFSYLSSSGDGLVSHFVSLLAEDNLSQILDPQVIEEGGKEVQEISILAASCIKLTGEDRPTMQEVEHALKSLVVSKKYVKDHVEKFEENGRILMNRSSGKSQQTMKESSRMYSMEQEFLLSARYPR